MLTTFCLSTLLVSLTTIFVLSMGWLSRKAI